MLVVQLITTVRKPLKAEARGEERGKYVRVPVLSVSG